MALIEYKPGLGFLGDAVGIDSAPTQNSQNLITSGAVFAQGNQLTATVIFGKSDDATYMAVPAGVTTAYVTSTYTDVSATIDLIMPTYAGAFSVTLSKNSGSPSDISAKAGTVVKLTVSGMSSSAAVGVFGVQFK